MKGRSIFELDVNGEKVGFRFGMLASAYTEEISGVSIYEVFKRIGQGLSIQSLLFYYYGGLRAYNEFNGIKKEITIPMVSEILEEIGSELAHEVYMDSIKVYMENPGDQKAKEEIVKEGDKKEGEQTAA